MQEKDPEVLAVTGIITDFESTPYVSVSGVLLWNTRFTVQPVSVLDPAGKTEPVVCEIRSIRQMKALEDNLDDPWKVSGTKVQMEDGSTRLKIRAISRVVREKEAPARDIAGELTREELLKVSRVAMEVLVRCLGELNAGKGRDAEGQRTFEEFDGLGQER
jgi:hypothetical protein